MKNFLRFVFSLSLMAGILAGCSTSPEQKADLEKSLKQEIDNFVENDVQGHWDKAYDQTTGFAGSPDKLKQNMAKSLPDNGVVTAGDIAAMAWEDDKTAKVKINWVFRQGSALGYSSETFVWVIKGGTWKLQGRALR